MSHGVNHQIRPQVGRFPGTTSYETVQLAIGNCSSGENILHPVESWPVCLVCTVCSVCILSSYQHVVIEITIAFNYQCREFCECCECCECCEFLQTDVAVLVWIQAGRDQSPSGIASKYIIPFLFPIDTRAAPWNKVTGAGRAASAASDWIRIAHTNNTSPGTL